MSVVIRVQGVPPDANSVDIRHFFSDFTIPKGGVYITGGTLGEAFIEFENDKEARRAIRLSGYALKNSAIKLSFSNKEDLKNACDTSLKNANRACTVLPPSGNGIYSGGPQTSKQNIAKKGQNVYLYLQGMPTNATMESIQAFFTGLPVVDVLFLKSFNGFRNGHCIVKFADHANAEQGLKRNKQYVGSQSVLVVESSEVEWFNSGGAADVAKEGSPLTNKRSRENEVTSQYLYLHGMPTNATKITIKEFFRGLYVEDAVFLKFPNGIRNGSGIVKFSDVKDAIEGIKRNKQTMHSHPITIMPSDREEWYKSGGIIGPRRKRDSPPRTFRDARQYRHRSSSGALRSRSRSPNEKDCYVQLANLPYNVEKKTIIKHLDILKLDDSQITFLFDRHGGRTREAIVMLKSERDRTKVGRLHRLVFSGRSLVVNLISETRALELIKKSGQKDVPKSALESQSNTYNCIYLRNFAFNVTKLDIKTFFAEFSLKDEDLFLLYDDQGIGIGEALVRFPTEKEAANAEKKMNRQPFRGTEILLRCIPENQMKAFGVECLNSSDVAPNNSTVCQKLPYPGSSLPLGTANTYANKNNSMTFIPAATSTNRFPENALTSASNEQIRTSKGAYGFTNVAPSINHMNYLYRPANTLPSVSTGFISAQSFPNIHQDNGERKHGSIIGSATQPSNTVKCVGNANYNNNPSSKPSGITLIHIKNLPFNITVGQILTFFDGFRVSSVNVNNVEKGTAVVRMATYEEAIAAINQLNNGQIGFNKLILSLL